MIYNPRLSYARFVYTTHGYQTIKCLVSLCVTEVLNFLKQSNNRLQTHQAFHETQRFLELG
jgi:hypothetical protein